MLLSSFHLNGHTLRFHPQIQKLEPSIVRYTVTFMPSLLSSIPPCNFSLFLGYEKFLLLFLSVCRIPVLLRLFQNGLYCKYLFSFTPSIEWFPIECRKTKTKVITLANGNRCKQHSEPIRIRSKYVKLMPSAGKRVRPKHDWFWFGFPLVEKVARVLLTNHRAQ